MDPQLVYEHGEVGVELVVADTRGEHYQGARVVDRHPGSLADDLLVYARPERLCGIGSTGLEGEGLFDLSVDLLVGQNSAALRLPGLPGTKEWQVSSVRMKSDGAGLVWYQENQPICVR